MTRRARAMTSREIIHDIGAISLWLFVALVFVMGIALTLEILATR